MKPLTFLVWRYVVNSIRRTISNPARAFVALVLLAWVAAIFAPSFRLFFPGTAKAGSGPTLTVSSARNLLTVFMIPFFVGAFTLMLTNSRIFRESESSFVFPSPLPRKFVFFFFLILRGFMVAIFLLIVFVMYSGAALKPVVKSLFGETLKASPWTVLLFPFLYVLGQLTVGFLGTYCALKIHARPRWKWRFYPVLWISVAVVLIAFGELFWKNLGLIGRGSAAFHLTMQEPLMVFLLFPFRSIADVAMIVSTGWTVRVGLGLLFWAALLPFSVALLVSQSSMMYDFAAHVAERSTLLRERMRNPVLNFRDWIERRQRKGKSTARAVWVVGSWQPHGVWALLWRNAITFWRQSSYGVMLLSGLLVAIFAGIGVAQHAGLMAVKVKSTLVLFVSGQTIITLFSTLFALIGLRDLLQRLDIEKPLPFPPRQVVVVEVLHIIVLNALWTFLLCVCAIFFFPAYWATALLLSIVSVSFLVPVSIGMFLLLLINPNQHDPIQQMLVGILQLPVAAICCTPGGVVLGLSLVLGLATVFAGIGALLANAATTYGLVELAGRKYESFNPMD
ncbi:MAG: putative ABC exporter domain-containing protein [Bacteroidota bacterium]